MCVCVCVSLRGGINDKNSNHKYVKGKRDERLSYRKNKRD